MQKASRLQDKWWHNVPFFLTALLVVAADQFSKMWITANIALGQSLFDAGFFRLTHIQNTGAAFGLFQGQSFALMILAIVGIVVILFYALFVYRHLPFVGNMLSKFALGMVLGGTVGNMIDRLRFGSVTDFVDFGFWPAFNVADSMIVIGVMIFAYSSLRSLSSSGRQGDG